MRERAPILGGPGPIGEEWVQARCEGCERTWEAHGTPRCRDTLRRLQKHADRTGHRIDVQHANRR